jgi:cardiolipin synthase
VREALKSAATLACAAAALGWVGVLPLPLLALVIGRDALLVGGSFYFRAITKRPGERFFNLATVEWKVAPSSLSKANTALQMLLVLAGVAHAGWGVPPAGAIGGLSWLVAATTLGSALDYWRHAGIKAGGGRGGGGGGGGDMIAAKAAEVRAAMLRAATLLRWRKP